MPPIVRCLLAAIITLIVFVDSTRAASPVDEGVTRLAGAISGFFERERHEKTVSVGAVISPDGDGDAAIREKLISALEAQEFTIRRAKLSVNGRFFREFRPEGTSGPDRVALRLKAEIRSRESDELIQPIAIPIFGEEAVRHLNPNVELPADISEDERHVLLNASIVNPQVTLDGHVVKTSPQSRFGVEVLARRDGTTVSLLPKDDQGFAFVPLVKGDEYLVRLHNNAEFEVAVALNIDGLSMYAFNEDGSTGNQVLVPAGRFADIPGWYITSDHTDVFTITSYAESAAKSKSIPMSGTGTITATFHAAWDPASVPPADEVGAKSADAATGRGRRIDQKYKSVRRVIGKQRALVTVRYRR